MVKNKAGLIIFLLLFASLLARGVGIASSPLGVYVDEAALAYNAYSLGLTGRDEYGHIMPVFLRSYGTFTSALVTYYLAVAVKWGGLEVHVIRLVPVVLGTLTVLVVYILARLMLVKGGVMSAFFAAMVMAMSPTHILFSRAFYEPTLALLLFALSVALWLRDRLIAACLFLSLAAYAYHPLRLIAYLWLGGWWVIRRGQITNRKTLLVAGLFVITQLPLIYLSFLPGPNSRFDQLSWLKSVSSPVEIAKEYSAQYISYVNPRNLFWLGDPDSQRSVPGVAVFYSWMVVPYLVGLVYLAGRIERYKLWWLLLAISPAVAALARDPFSTSRAIVMMVPLTLVVGLGICQLTAKGKLFTLAVVGAFLISGLFLYRGVGILLPATRFQVWNYGYQQLFDFIAEQDKPALVDSDLPLYVLYLFYQKVDPRYVQSLGKTQVRNYYKDSNWENYYYDSKVRFARIVWEEDIYLPQLIAGSGLLVSSNQAREHFLSKEFQFDYLGQTLVAAYSTHPEEKLKSLIY